MLTLKPNENCLIFFSTLSKEMLLILALAVYFSRMMLSMEMNQTLLIHPENEQN